MGRSKAGWFWRAVTSLEARSPAWSFWLKKAFIQYGVPFNRAIGLRFAGVSGQGDTFRLRLPYRRRNTNVEGTVHGGVITAFGESVFGVSVYWQFPPSSISMVTREIQIAFLKPARGDLFIEYKLEAPQREKILADLARQGRCEIQFTCQVTDREGDAVAQLQASFAIRNRGRSTVQRGAGPSGAAA